MVFIIITQYHQMGQSMKEPSRSQPLRSQSRLSSRSLQRNSRNSAGLEKKVSLSASKLQHNSFSEGEQGENTLIRKGELQILSTHRQLKPLNTNSKIFKHNGNALAADPSQASPQFHQYVQAGREYGLEEWEGSPGHKGNETPRNDTAGQQDVTISFSKGRNNNNVFQEDSEERRDSIQQILEESAEIVKEMRADIELNSPILHTYDPHEIEKISATRSVYSDNFKLQSNVHPPQGNSENKEIVELQEQSYQASKFKEKAVQQHDNVGSKIKQQKQKVVEAAVTYNDYDCADFNKASEQSSVKNQKLSKKMIELKEKIANKASNSKEKQQLLNRSIKRLSNSFKQSSIDHSRDDSRGDSKDRIHRLTHGHFANMTLTGSDSRKQYQIKDPGQKGKNKPVLGSPKEKAKPKKDKGSQPRDEIKKMRSNENLGKTAHSSKQSLNQFHKKPKEVMKKPQLTEKTPYIQPNQVVRSPKGKERRLFPREQAMPKGMETSFTDMVKKEHYGYKHQCKTTETVHQQTIKYSQIDDAKNDNIQAHLFASTCIKGKVVNSNNPDYDFIQGQQQKKEVKKRASNQLSELKVITKKLNANEQSRLMPRNRYDRDLNMTANHFSSGRNRTLDQRSGCDYGGSGLNRTEMPGAGGGEYMLRQALKKQRQGREWMREEKRRYRSSDHSSRGSNYRSKLLVF